MPILLNVVKQSLKQDKFHSPRKFLTLLVK